jgi:hypothetical protein
MTTNSLAARRLEVAGVCLVFLLLNWHVETRFFRPADGRLTGIQVEYGPIAVALAIAAGFTVWCLWSVWRNFRAIARLRTNAYKGLEWSDAAGVLYLAPLLFQFDCHSSWIDPSGRSAQTTYFFGHLPLSLALFFLALGGVFLFQIRTRLIDVIHGELRRTRCTD